MVSLLVGLILTIMDAIMLFVAQIHQAAVAPPAIGVNHALGWVHPSPDGGLQSGLGAIWRDLGVDPATPLQYAEDWCCAISATSPFSFYPPCPELRFVNLDLSYEGRLVLTHLSGALVDHKKVKVARVTG